MSKNKKKTVKTRISTAFASAIEKKITNLETKKEKIKWLYEFKILAGSRNIAVAGQCDEAIGDLLR